MKKGFTLVELSIVLIVIGLLVGGLIAARSMIETTRIQAQIKQIDEFDSAVTVFTTTYQSLPGDSTAFGHGNGDGKIWDSYAVTTVTGPYVFTNEVANFWVDLGLNGFMKDKGITFTSTVPAGGFNIKSTTPNSPKAAIEDNTGVVAGTSYMCQVPRWGAGCWQVTFYQFGNYSAYTSGYLNNSATDSISPNQAGAIDKKVDDSNPLTGFVQVVTDKTAYIGADIGTPNANCTIAGSATYPNAYVNSNTKACLLIVQMMRHAGGPPYRASKF